MTNLKFNLKNCLYDNIVTSQSSSLWEAFKQTCSSLLDEDSSNILPEVNSLIFLLDVKFLNIFLVDTSFLFLLLSNITLDKTYSSSYSLLDEVSSLVIELSEDRSIIEILFSKETTRVDISSYSSSSNEFFDEIARDYFRFELMLSSFNNWINSFNFFMICSFLDFYWKS